MNKDVLSRRRMVWRGTLRAGSMALFLAVTLVHPHLRAYAQGTVPKSTLGDEDVQLQLQRLSSAAAAAEAQVELSRQQVIELRREIAQLQTRFAGTSAGSPQNVESFSESSDGTLSAAIEDLRERQDLQQAQLATHEQAKVETATKYPLQLTGLVLVNGFNNSSAVDSIASPSLAGDGQGSAGASFRQTILGIDARGPHILHATTRADLRVDFFGGATASSYGTNAGLLRLRTAHGTLDWGRTQLVAALDRPIFSPHTPTSLTAVAQPALAWSGNLWTWLPQVGVTHDLGLGEHSRLTLEGGIMDVPDPPQLTASAMATNASLAESSRWPGTEARIAFGGNDREHGAEIGVGGYFSPHRINNSHSFNAWAGTLDLRIPLPARLEITGSFYRGLALGGLGGGVYKDYLYAVANGVTYLRPLDDVGGWLQTKARISGRLQVNAAFGVDNGFSRQLRLYASSNRDPYISLARNHTAFANAIFSPKASTLFSLEYRRIESFPITGARSAANVVGVAAGYRF